MPDKPRLLDLFCGAGGAAMGYSLAGFEVTGVDLADQPRFPFAFHQGDALEYLREHGAEFDAIHASPPCQLFSATGRATGKAANHPDLLTPTRALLLEMDRPWVIENVQGAPFGWAMRLCGFGFGLRLHRHRLFELPWLILGHPDCPGPQPEGTAINPYKSANRRAAVAKGLPYISADSALYAKAMGVPWMRGAEISQAIPPAYTQWIGNELLRGIYTFAGRDPDVPPKVAQPLEILEV